MTQNPHAGNSRIRRSLPPDDLHTRGEAKIQENSLFAMADNAFHLEGLESIGLR